MKFFIGGRGCGKTLMAIRESSTTGIPIVCHNPDYVKELARGLRVRIPEPISFYDTIKPGKLHGRHTVIVDELGYFLKSIGIFAKAVTMDETDVDSVEFLKKGDLNDDGGSDEKTEG